MRPNWFVAFPVQLGAAYAPLVAAPPPAVRVFQPADLHLTAAFLGGVDEATARAAWTHALGVLPPALTALAGPVAPYGNPRRPSALALTLDAGRDAVVAWLAAHACGILAAAGLPPESRAPDPHITIARPDRQASHAERRVAVEWAATLAPPSAPVVLDRLALYTWALDRSRGQFRVVEDVALSP